MAEYVLCPVCHNPALVGEPCAVCAGRAQEQAAAPEVKAAEETFVAPETRAPKAAFAEAPEMGARAADSYRSLFSAEGAAPDSAEYGRLMENTYAPMKTGALFGTLLLFLVPLAGLIFAIVFACGACRKRQKVLLARAFLLVVLTLAALAAALFFGYLCLAKAGLLPLCAALSPLFPL